MPKHEMKESGRTIGRSGTKFRYVRGQVIEADAGEFDHLPKGAYVTRPLTPQAVTRPTVKKAEEPPAEDAPKPKRTARRSKR